VDSLRSIASQVAPYIYIALLIAVVVLIKHYLEPNGEEEAHLYVAGPIMVLDGDTLKAGEREYRIFGIDAPEFSQACSEPSGQLWNCGRAARARLRALVAGAPYSVCPGPVTGSAASWRRAVLATHPISARFSCGRDSQSISAVSLKVLI